MEEVLNKEVPKILVQTWILLANNQEADDGVKIRALSMLQGLVGTSQENNAVEAWIGLVRNDKCSKKVRTMVLQMLTNSLGSVEEIAAYMKRNNIK